MHPEFFRTALAQAASHAHTAPIYHSLVFGIVVALVGGWLLSVLFGRTSN